jgi:glycine dehydrogenase subunit 1
MRYTQISKSDIQKMLKTIGVDSISELFSDIPKSKYDSYPNLNEKGFTEIELRKQFTNYAEKNRTALKYKNFLGGGFYEHYIPSIVETISSRSEFYTAYTPYQAEISQGSLQMMFEFQTMMSEITGLPVSNASMYDGATAFAEAFLMAYRVFRGKKNKFFYSFSVNPIYIDVLKTYTQFKNDFDMIPIPVKNGRTDIDFLRENIDENTAAVGVSYPNFFGQIEDYDEIVKITKEKGAIPIASFYPICSSILKRPGEYGFEIVVGNGQSLGIPLYFSGPTYGFFSTKQEYLRQIPGRLVSETTDLDGKRGFVMTLQTREQHIRRERATSNICSNQAIDTLRAAVYLSFIGKEGFRKLGKRILKMTSYAMKGLEENGISIRHSKKRVFNEFVIDASNDRELFEKGRKKGFLIGLPLSKFTNENGILVAITEMKTKEEIDELVNFFKGEFK